jgi:hypothetical protein
MTLRLTRSTVFLIALFSISCFGNGAFELPNSPGDKVTREVIEYVKAGEIESALGFFDLDELPANASELLAGTTPLLSETTEVDLINFRFFKSFSEDKVDESFAYHAKGRSRAALVFVSVRTLDGVTTIRSFKVHQVPIDLKSLYPFTFLGMHPLHYLVLVLSISVPIFILVTVVAIARSSRRRKWLWILFTVFGFGKFGVQWLVGGRWFFQLFAFQVLGASVLKNPLYEPWVLSVSLPLGAILFWVTNRSMPDNEPPLERQDVQDHPADEDNHEPPNQPFQADPDPRERGSGPLNSNR